MKTMKRIMIGAGLIISNLTFSQEQLKETCTVLDIQVKGNAHLSAKEAGNLTRHLMNQLSLYNVSYDQDINYILKEEELKNYKVYEGEFRKTLKSNVMSDTSITNKRAQVLTNIDNAFYDIETTKKEKLIEKSGEVSYECYSIQCLEKVGKILGSDKMLSGYIELIRNNYIISFREFDVKTGRISRSISREYRDIPEQIKNMVLITLQDMYDLEVNKQMEMFISQ
ncbi:MAG: hypothetical protein P8N07_03580, partial [Flavobacteriales bacterium]|nr:hypothetical protein [Flavobacteriales bacterium]